MAEMSTGKPLFPGKTNEDQLIKIFKLFGTPTEDTWPGVTQFSEWKPIPWFPAQDLHGRMGMLGNAGLDLMIRMLQYQPQLRVAARDALSHVYFKDHVMKLQQQLQNRQGHQGYIYQ